ncbi:energy transducer TonB [Pelagicoccus sp. SDUM812002]|uniref:energy transducer TonB n=1 Tax=Pelagicoccus sp. SDUM812002 TaxID=3041266 RepID=UPI00280EE162|nr:energy transducer TonB [Pelagicoccus sp. SDUM812002]MDQ8187891.1 energy transducer TonB [Pelagicoccus sp. SDUM812002]
MKRSQNSTLLGTFCILAAFVISIAASAATSVPTPKKTVASHLTDALSDATGEVNILVDINEFGYVIDAQIYDSTNSDLNEVTLSAIHRWTFHPAIEDGVATPSRVVQPFNFNRGSIVLKSKKSPEDSLPIAKVKAKPQLTEDLKHITGEVILQADLDASGEVAAVTVNYSTHSELEDIASKALKSWKFKPATEAGEAVASKIIIPFHFKGSGNSKVVAAARRAKNVESAPYAIRQTMPELPRFLRDAKGEAKLKLTIDASGYVAKVDVLESSHSKLTEVAREAALQWKFKPAMKNGKAVPSTVTQPFTFNGGLLVADVPVDSVPVAKHTQSPKIPEALALVRGYVKIRVSLDERGRVINASCANSTHEELVGPSIEAAKQWSFKPAIRAGEKVPSSVLIPFVFNEQS